MASWLASRGHEVRVVAAPPYYPAWSVREDYRRPFYRTERVAGEPVVFRTPLYVPSKPSGIKRMIHLFSFMLFSSPVMLRQIFWQPDVVFTIEPTFFGAPLALLVASLSGAASWLHVQDFEVDAAFELGLLPAEGPIHSFAMTLEKIFTRSFTRVSSISVKMVERSISKGMEPDRVVLFPNWVDVQVIHPKPLPSALREELGLQDKIVLLYSGNMGAKQGLETLAPLAQSFAPGAPGEDPRVHFVFCGDGALRPSLEALIGHLPNCTLLPLQPLERLNDLLNTADIHLLPQRGGAADLVMPSKLTGALASGRPVIATADAGTQVARVVDDGSFPCGVVVPAEDAVALHAAVIRLINNPELCANLGRNAREYAVQYLGKQEVLRQFERDLLSVTEKVPSPPARHPSSSTMESISQSVERARESVG